MPVRKRFVVFLLALLLPAPPATAMQISPETSRPGPCPLVRREDETLRHFVKRQIRCAVEELGPVTGGAERAICIADRESGLNPAARSATGMYLGLYQHAATYWPARYDKWTKRSWELSDDALNGRTNGIVTIRMVQAAGGWRAAGWPVRGC
jgi:hypothetical protein